MTEKNNIRILSWDVGIKNLAGCFLDCVDKKSSISWWNIINLLDEDKLSCCGKIIKKNKNTNILNIK